MGMEHKKPSWDSYFLDIARVVSSRSSCLKSMVGAVIVSPSLKIVSTGYNAPPHGVTDSITLGYCNKEKYGFKSGEGYEVCRSIHAEQNAIIQAGSIQCQNAAIYIWGHSFICNFCKKFILQAGITKAILQKEESSSIVIQYPKDWIDFLSNPFIEKEPL
jgi:dCMP deaminase